MCTSVFALKRRLIAARVIAELPAKEFAEEFAKLDPQGMRQVARLVLVISERINLERAFLRLSSEEKLTLLRAWRSS